MALNAVVLPAPFGPMRESTSPSLTSKVALSTATSPPKRIDSASTLRSAAVPVTRLPCSAVPSLRRRCHHCRTAGHDPRGQEVQDEDHEHAVDDPLHLGRDRECAQRLGQQAEDQPADDRAGERALPAGDDHDHHRHGVDEQEHVGIDDADVVRVERARRARHRGRDDRGEHQVAGHVDADRSRERLVLPERDHGAAGTRADEPADEDVRDDRDAEDEPVVLRLLPEDVLAHARQPQGERRDVVERHRTLRQLDPVHRDQAHHLGEADRHDHEIGAAHPERDLPDEPAERPGDDDRREHPAPHRLRVEGERDARRERAR